MLGSKLLTVARPDRKEEFGRLKRELDRVFFDGGGFSQLEYRSRLLALYRQYPEYQPKQHCYC